MGTPDGDALAEAVLAAVRDGLSSGEKPVRAPRKGTLGPEAAKDRKEREARLTAWRREEAKKRGVDEQVVLPGHCLKDIAALPGTPDASALAAVPGLGAFRVDRDGPAIARALTTPRLPVSL